MRYSFVLLGFAIALVGIGASTFAQEDAASRLRREGIRAMSRGEPERMAATGLNLCIPWNSPLLDATKSTPPDSEVILRAEDFSRKAVDGLREQANQCRTNGILMMSMLYVATEPEIRFLTGLEPTPDGHLLKYLGGFEAHDMVNSRTKKLWPAHDYRHVVDMIGGTARWAPCPLERRYWLGFIQPELELVARVLKETGVSGGAALELEAYCFYSIYPGMASQKNSFCYCDECFYGFVRAHARADVADAVPPEHRFNWLTQRGWLPAYEQSLEDRLAAIIEEMMISVRKVNPQFLFGMYPYAPHWYYDALVRGGGTPELPCLLFSSAEYFGGYSAEPAPTFNGDMPTAACLDHLRARKLHALYAGGLYDNGIRSPDAYALAMDPLLRRANGFWAYRELPPGEFEPSWKPMAAVNDFHRRHPDPLPAGTVRNVMPNPAKPIVARYRPDREAPPLIVESFEDEVELRLLWTGRGALPSLDPLVAHAGKVSLRFEPTAAGPSPRSPFIDRSVPGASAQPREISFWVKTDAAAPVRLYVGTAASDQYPAYMWYYNFALPARQDWTRLRIAPVTGGNLPRLDVIRFWCQSTEGRVWLDEVEVRSVQEGILDVPLTLPQDATGWGAVAWRLKPADAAVQAELVAADEERVLWKRLGSGDNLAPLAAVVGLEPVRLRLRVYPSALQVVSLEEVTLGAVLPNRP